MPNPKTYGYDRVVTDAAPSPLQLNKLVAGRGPGWRVLQIVMEGPRRFLVYLEREVAP